MNLIPFDDFLESLTDLGGVSRRDAGLLKQMKMVVNELRKLDSVSAESLAQFIRDFPQFFPALASCTGLGQEQLKNQLRFRFGTTGWVTLAKERPSDLINRFDQEFELVQSVKEQLAKKWTFADVLAERSLWSRRTGSKAVGQGRSVEDEVEEMVRKLGFSYQMRCRFSGLGGEGAPCDLAIPTGGNTAQIVIALKSNNSTGSKQGDAVREIEDMANKRLPRQFVFVVFDGIGWLSRQADLRRVYNLWSSQRIDGLYSLAYQDYLEKDLVEAANILRLPRNPQP